MCVIEEREREREKEEKDSVCVEEGGKMNSYALS